MWPKFSMLYSLPYEIFILLTGYLTAKRNIELCSKKCKPKTVNQHFDNVYEVFLISRASRFSPGTLIKTNF